MRDVNASVPYLHFSALQSALAQALGLRLVGMTAEIDASQAARNVRLHVADAAAPADEAMALSLASAHDPVFLSVDKASIQANGSDAATITVRAPIPGAAPVTLTITSTSPFGSIASQDDPITLVGGVGTETITALDPCTISIVVKNSANRSIDTLTISAR